MLLSHHDSGFILLNGVQSIILTFATVSQVSKYGLKDSKNGNADITMCQPLLIAPLSAAVVYMTMTF